MRSIAFGVLVTSIATLSAQEVPDTVRAVAKPSPHRDAQLATASPEFQAFAQQAGGTWVSNWNYATETPRAIYGSGLRLDGWRGDSEAEARRHGEWVLTTWRDLLRLGTSEFREVIAAKMGGTRVLVYDQFFRGLPALGGRADVRIHETGVLSMFGSQAWQIPAGFGTVPTVTELNAVRIAWQALGMVPPLTEQPGRNDGTRLVIWGDIEAAEKQPFFLAWEVPVSAVALDGSGPIGRYYVDAHTGRVLHYENDKHECGNPGCGHPHHDLGGGEESGPPPAPVSGTVMAFTRTGLSAVSPVVNVPLAGLEVVVPGVGTAITDSNGFFSINSALTTPVNVTVNMNGIHCQLITGADAPTQTLSVTPGTPASFQLLSAAATSNQAAHTSTYYWTHAVNEFCRAILGNTAQLNTASNVLPRVNIASTCNAYYTGNTINFYAAGGSCNNTGFSSVVAHEWGHGIDDRYGGISNSNGDGLSEAWGDIVAMYLVGDAVVGRDFTTSGGFVRTGTNTRQFTSLTGTTGVHAAGEVFMGMCWKLRGRLQQSLGAAAGTARANTIVIGSIVADATNQTNAVMEIFLADDNDGNVLNGTPNYADIVWACQQHSLPYPIVQVGSIAHTPLPATTVQLTPRRVDATVTPVSGSFTEVRLHFDTGTGPTSRPMLPSGQPNGYVALLPGILAPGAVTYHIEAVHSGGTVVRLPATGEFASYTGSQNTLFFDNLETGAPGWTNGQVATQNDWQLGRPAGRTGTSSGIAWRDPSAPASGNNSWGNDLGNVIGTTNWNGAYAANVENWLRSPTINCSGQTGVTLRFKRWLQVEEALFDQAQIRVNNTVVWQNPTNGHLQDTAWVTFELPIPQADNNPAVVIEWRLKTDGGLQLGGWNIDDIEVLAAGAVPPLDAQLRLSPDMPQLGATMTLGVVVRPTVPFLFVLGDGAGPTNIPGIPTLLVGGNAFTLPGWTDALGLFSVSFGAPTSPATVGTFWYSQVLTIDAVGNLVTSNQHLNLFRN